MKVFIKAVKIVTETCCSCGVVFGLNEDFKNKLLRSGDNFYCTNGHPQHYTRKKSLQKKLTNALREIETLKCRIELCVSEPIYAFCDFRFERVLNNGGVKTIGDALEFGEFRLRSMYGVGDVCISQIKDNLERYNINLKP